MIVWGLWWGLVGDFEHDVFLLCVVEWHGESYAWSASKDDFCSIPRDIVNLLMNN